MEQRNTKKIYDHDYSRTVYIAIGDDLFFSAAYRKWKFGNFFFKQFRWNSNITVRKVSFTK